MLGPEVNEMGRVVEKIVFDVAPELKRRWLQRCRREGVTQAEMFRRLVQKEEGSRMTEIRWTNEQAPQFDSTGTIAESWFAEVDGYHVRIDRFHEGGYAYTVERDGNPLRNAENESADSWENAVEFALTAIGH